MNANDQHFWDILTNEEAEFSAACMDALRGETCVRGFLEDIAANGGLTRANKGRLFELRFAHALYRQGIAPAYEVPGEGESTLDFGFTAGGRHWRVELMRLEETDAAQAATHTQSDESGVIWSQRVIGNNRADPRQTEAGETIKAVQRICQKSERNGQPHKFPAPREGLHVLLVDFRNFLHGGDGHDRVHVALGGEYVRDPYCRQYWDGNLVTGAFHPQTTVRGAAFFRERVHFLGFVNEEEYGPDAFAGSTEFVANPGAFANVEEMRAAIDAWPLQPTIVLNGGRRSTA